MVGVPIEDVSSLPTRTWMVPGYTMEELRERLELAKFQRVQAEVVRIAGEDTGAWAALVDLTATLLCPAEPTCQGLSASRPKPPHDADFTARRIAGSALARTGRIPANLPALASVVATRATGDDRRTGEAMIAMNQIREFGSLVLDWAEAVLGLAAGRPCRWEVLVTPLGHNVREALATPLLKASLSGPLDTRSTAAIAAACLALLEREAGNQERDAAVWTSLGIPSQSFPVTTAVVGTILQASGLGARIVAHLMEAGASPGLLDRVVLSVVVNRALVALGCQEVGAIDPDPVRRALRRTVTSMLDCDGGELAAELFSSLCQLAPEAGSKAPSEDPLRRGRWGHLLQPVASQSTRSDSVRLRAAAALALLALLDVRMRGVSKEQVEIGARADVRGETAYSCLHRAVGSPGLPEAMRAIARTVLDQRVTSEPEICARIEDQLTSAVAKRHAQQRPGRRGARTTPPREAWVAYDGMKAGLTTRDLAKAIGARLRRSVSPGTISKWNDEVTDYLVGGGTRPSDLPSPPPTPRRRTLAPDVIERGQPKQDRRAR